MAHKGIIVNVKFLAVLAILNITLIDVLIIVPASKFSLRVFIFKYRKK
jgi:hypothetical protein